MYDGENKGRQIKESLHSSHHNSSPAIPGQPLPVQPDLDKTFWRSSSLPQAPEQQLPRCGAALVGPLTAALTVPEVVEAVGIDLNVFIFGCQQVFNSCVSRSFLQLYLVYISYSRAQGQVIKVIGWWSVPHHHEEQKAGVISIGKDAWSSAAYERVVCKNPSKYHYMKVCLEFQDHGAGLNAAQFKQLLISALKDLFGEVDAAFPLDVLTYEEKNLSAILRICSSGLVKLWSSFTLLGSYKGKKCAFRVIQVSLFLLALSGNSRELVPD
ncbi:uncharacterized protein LOC110595579 [Carlito syrichta]|uniref:Ribonuclease P protein subunit p14 n=1 Tax=Carlito syrichta TaxID=1868482 RepID=A0A3Q0DWT5_CARSF|nr:uncharacterized protein LOC110595579 [Carlito syrichta]